MSRPNRLRELTVPELARMAHAFDELSDSEATGARYPATRFVDFVKVELAVGRNGKSLFEPGHRPRRKQDELQRFCSPIGST